MDNNWNVLWILLIVIVGTVGLKLIFNRLFPKFEWRLLLITVPVILAGWLAVVAYQNTNDPQSTGKRFNLGVDLAGVSLTFGVGVAFGERGKGVAAGNGFGVGN